MRRMYIFIYLRIFQYLNYNIFVIAILSRTSWRVCNDTIMFFLILITPNCYTVNLPELISTLFILVCYCNGTSFKIILKHTKYLVCDVEGTVEAKRYTSGYNCFQPSLVCSRKQRSDGCILRIQGNHLRFQKMCIFCEYNRKAEGDQPWKSAPEKGIDWLETKKQCGLQTWKGEARFRGL